ncbi:MAG: hypoxanthine phosphoribosyltransferase [Ruminococcus sp.]|nr:hypoxanthine phosphoribosyltransferase [Candidatus Apopatosoma intestinale]
MNRDIQSILLSERKIRSISKRIGREISRDYADKKLVLVGTLKGALPFMAEVLKNITVPCEIDFVKVSSYGSGTTSSGTLKILLDLLRSDMAECDVLIVEDIVDSGNTLSKLTKYMREKGAKSVRTCTLLDKPSRREVEFEADYVGTVIPDEFVVGFGLDYDEKYRNLPYIGVLKKEVYQK